MIGKSTTISDHNPYNHNTCNSGQNDLNQRPTSENYKYVFPSFMDIECDHEPVIQNVPPPYRNNIKTVDSPLYSPLRRPHSSSENGQSDNDDFELDPNTKTVQKNRKKTKTSNNNTKFSNLNISNKTRSPYPIATTINLIAIPRHRTSNQHFNPAHQQRSN